MSRRRTSLLAVGASVLWVALVAGTQPAAHAATTPVAGGLVAFGDDNSGEFGVSIFNGSQTHATPTAVNLPASVATLAQGYDFTLAVTTDGTLYGFGDNDYGQLSVHENIGTDKAVPPTVIPLPGATGGVVSVAATAGDSYALTSTGQLFTFGDANGVGRTAPNGDGTVPAVAPMPDGGATTMVAAGSSHVLVATSLGDVYALGSDTSGEQGPGGTVGTYSPTFVKVTGLPAATRSTRVVGLSAGNDTSYVLSANGTVYDFGNNENSELGRAEDSGANPAPTAVTGFPSGVSVTSVSAGFNSVLALAGGKVYGWGEDSSGQLGTAGDAQLDPVQTPTVITPVVGAAGVVAVSETMMSSFLTTSRGQLISFGANGYGQLGRTPDATNIDAVPTLVTLPAGTTVDAPPQGDSQSMVILVSDLVIGPGAFPNATVGAAYGAAPPSTGGRMPLTVSAVSPLPAGLYLSAAGQIDGTPTGLPGSTTVSYTVTDADGVTVTGSEPLTVVAAPVAAPPVTTPPVTTPPVAAPVVPAPVLPAPGVPVTVKAPSNSAIISALVANLVPKGKSAAFAVLAKKGYSQTVSVLETGKLTVTWTYQPRHGKKITVATGTTTFTRTGLSHLTVKLTKAGAALLKAGHTVGLTFTATFGHLTGRKTAKLS